MEMQYYLKDPLLKAIYNTYRKKALSDISQNCIKDPDYDINKAFLDLFDNKSNLVITSGYDMMKNLYEKNIGFSSYLTDSILSNTLTTEQKAYFYPDYMLFALSTDRKVSCNEEVIYNIFKNYVNNFRKIYESNNFQKYIDSISNHHQKKRSNSLYTVLNNINSYYYTITSNVRYSFINSNIMDVKDFLNDEEIVIEKLLNFLNESIEESNKKINKYINEDNSVVFKKNEKKNIISLIDLLDEEENKNRPLYFPLYSKTILLKDIFKTFDDLVLYHPNKSFITNIINLKNIIYSTIIDNLNIAADESEYKLENQMLVNQTSIIENLIENIEKNKNDKRISFNEISNTIKNIIIDVYNSSMDLIKSDVSNYDKGYPILYNLVFPYFMGYYININNEYGFQEIEIKKEMSPILAIIKKYEREQEEDNKLNKIKNRILELFPDENLEDNNVSELKQYLEGKKVSLNNQYLENFRILVNKQEELLAKYSNNLNRVYFFDIKNEEVKFINKVYNNSNLLLNLYDKFLKQIDEDFKSLEESDSKYDTLTTIFESSISQNNQINNTKILNTTKVSEYIEFVKKNKELLNNTIKDYFSEIKINKEFLKLLKEIILKKKSIIPKIEKEEKKIINEKRISLDDIISDINLYRIWKENN